MTAFLVTNGLLFVEEKKAVSMPVVIVAAIVEAYSNTVPVVASFNKAIIIYLNANNNVQMANSLSIQPHPPVGDYLTVLYSHSHIYIYI